MTLTDFLLARIAEDEKDWRAVDRRDVVQHLHGKPLAPRMLAECVAKRRIVELLGPLLDPFSVSADRACSMEVQRAEETLELLALPYADHEDWREEWKP